MQRSLGYEVAEPVFSIEGQKVLEKERKRKKKMAGIYDIKEDDGEDKSDASSDIEEKKDSEEEDESQAVIPYVPILQRTLDEMNHYEAQEETQEALAIMFDQVREQTMQLQDMFQAEESKLQSHLHSSTKKSTLGQS